MGLDTYHRKRDFSTTPEPVGEVGRSRASGRSYVIQRHAARRLHHDFRLEHDGVLLSWAVPKGPSRDPAEKRLAVRVEDHPLDYGDFEGTIPAGEYGGGTVMVWDRGTWEPDSDVAAGLDAGKLSFVLHGERLKGRWKLIRTKRGQDWLLFKSRDDEAVDGDGAGVVEAHATSVVSNRSMDAIAEAEDRVWTRGGEVPTEAELLEVDGAVQGEVPWPLGPELATLVDQAPSGSGWIHELKLDGYRILARADQGVVSLVTRSGQDWTEKFPVVARAVGALPVPVVLDGELVAMEAGRPSFSALQKAIGTGRGVQLHVFDLVAAAGVDLRGVPLVRRKELLGRVIGPGRTGPLRLVEHVEDPGPRVWEAACALGAEGIVSKRADALYRSSRTRDWVKVKCRGREDFVVVGFVTRPGSKLSSLLVAEGEPLRYAGRVGTGFTEATRDDLRSRLDPRVVDAPPVDAPKARKPDVVHWVAPGLRIEVRFQERTAAGILRHPSFLGVREDRPTRGARTPARPVPAVSNPDKVLYPDVGLTKGALAAWVEAMAPLLLPHVADRPLSLVRCPNGVGRPCFFQKHRGSAPKAVLPVQVPGHDEAYLMVRDAEGLVGLVQLGALEIHPWGARSATLDRPDRLILDLDPDVSLGFDQVAAAAEEARDRLADLGLVSFVRTTGGKGLHVVAPLAPKADWDRVKELSRRVAAAMVRDAPTRFVAKSSKASRTGRVFVDWLRNGAGSTAVATWSPRARPSAPVAVPLAWSDLRADLDRSAFTVLGLPTVPDDPWDGFAEVDQAVTRAMVDRLESH